MTSIYKSAIDKSKSMHPHWLFALFILSLVPAIETLLTWDLDGIISNQHMVIRHISFIIFVVEIFVAVILIRSVNKSQSDFQVSKAAKATILFTAFCAILSLILSKEGQANGIYLLARYATHLLLFYCILKSWPKDLDHDNHLWLIFISCGGLLYTVTLVLFVFLVPDWKGFNWASQLPSATNVRQIGDKIAMLAAAPAALALFSAGRTRTLALVALGIMIGFVAWTGTRGGLMGFGAGLLFAVIFAWRDLSKLGVALVVIAVAVGTLLSAGFPVPAPEFGIMRVVEANQAADVSAGRTVVWEFAISKIMENPWLGYGSGNFRDLMLATKGFTFNHPHNFVLQFIFDWGVFGAASALLLLSMWGWNLVSSRTISPFARFAALIGFGTWGAVGMVDGVFYYPYPIITAIMLSMPFFAEKYVKRAI